MRGFLALYWKLVGWSYRRQVAAQNKHGARVNKRIALLTSKARAAERRAERIMGRA